MSSANGLCYRDTMTDQTTPAPEPGSLPLENQKHERFALEYLIDLNATQAAIRAGYAKGSAHVTGHRLINDAKVGVRIDNLRQSKLKALHMGVDEVLAEIAKIGRASMGRILHITPDGDPYIDLGKADADTLDAVAEATIEDFTDGREVDEKGETIKRDVRRVKVKMHPKLAALTTLAKHHGLLDERVKVTLDEDFADTMLRSRERAKEARRARTKEGDDAGQG